MKCMYLENVRIHGGHHAKSQAPQSLLIADIIARTDADTETFGELLIHLARGKSWLEAEIVVSPARGTSLDAVRRRVSLPDVNGRDLWAQEAVLRRTGEASAVFGASSAKEFVGGVEWALMQAG